MGRKKARWGDFIFSNPLHPSPPIWVDPEAWTMWRTRSSFFKVTFRFPEWRSLKPRKGHLSVQKRSLWRTWMLKPVQQRTLVSPCLFTFFYSSQPPGEELWNSFNISGSQECVWVTQKEEKTLFVRFFWCKIYGVAKKGPFDFFESIS